MIQVIYNKVKLSLLRGFIFGSAKLRHELRESLRWFRHLPLRACEHGSMFWTSRGFARCHRDSRECATLFVVSRRVARHHGSARRCANVFWMLRRFARRHWSARRCANMFWVSRRVARCRGSTRRCANIIARLMWRFGYAENVALTIEHFRALRSVRMRNGLCRERFWWSDRLRASRGGDNLLWNVFPSDFWGGLVPLQNRIRFGTIYGSCVSCNIKSRRSSELIQGWLVGFGIG